MDIYALIIESLGDDDRLIGLYSSLEAARAAYDAWEDRGYYPFYRVEERPLDGAAFEWSPGVVVFSYGGED